VVLPPFLIVILSIFISMEGLFTSKENILEKVRGLLEETDV
jgi:hypothetical protein